MFAAFYWSKTWVYKAYGGAIVMLAALYLQMCLAVRITHAAKGFNDILPNAARYTVAEFDAALVPWFWYGVYSIAINCSVGYLFGKYALWWRNAVTDYFRSLIRKTEGEVKGAGQVIQELVPLITKTIHGIASSIVHAIFTLIAFTPLLWALSAGFQLRWLPNIPGLLVFITFGVSILGLTISWLTGAFLTHIEYQVNNAEADFRSELVLCERYRRRSYDKTLDVLFENILKSQNKNLFWNALVNLGLSLYQHMIWFLPLVLLAPNLIYGFVTFGVLMLIRDAFTSVDASVGKFIVNTQVRCVWRQLREFELRLADDVREESKAQNDRSPRE